MTDSPKESSGFSRRAFLRGSGVAAAAVGIAPVLPTQEAQAAQSAAESSRPLGPGPVSVSLTVNEKPMTVSVEPRITLLDALRDYLDVTGCKRVCDRGTCGACTILVDGLPVYSCTMLAVDAAGAKITTDEGLGTEEAMHPVQKAFWERDASQCGFCTPGFVVACAAVLKQNPSATAEEIRRGLEGNICRCGTYEQMAQAIEDLAGGKV